jgi:hypothetical protein
MMRTMPGTLVTPASTGGAPPELELDPPLLPLEEPLPEGPPLEELLLDALAVPASRRAPASPPPLLPELPPGVAPASAPAPLLEPAVPPLEEAEPVVLDPEDPAPPPLEEPEGLPLEAPASWSVVADGEHAHARAVSATMATGLDSFILRLQGETAPGPAGMERYPCRSATAPARLTRSGERS